MHGRPLSLESRIRTQLGKSSLVQRHYQGWVVGAVGVRIQTRTPISGVFSFNGAFVIIQTCRAESNIYHKKIAISIVQSDTNMYRSVNNYILRNKNVSRNAIKRSIRLLHKNFPIITAVTKTKPLWGEEEFYYRVVRGDS